MRKINAREALTEFAAQKVSSSEHIAFKCPRCHTVQSMASLARACVPLTPPAKLGSYIGFSCEGRFNGAGEWPSDPAAQAARTKRGCNWTLGGLFQIHELIVVTPEGEQPSFEIATPDEAQALERLMAEPVAEPV